MSLLAALLLTLAPIPDDPYEENDTCLEAALLSVAPNGQVHSFQCVSSGAASAGGADEDWFQVDVPAGHRMRVDVSGQFPGGPGITTRLRTGPQCGQVVDSSFVGGGPMFAINAASVSEAYFLQLEPVNPTFVQESIFISIRIRPEVCSTLLPDAYEPNDTLATAPVLPPGVHRGLTLTEDSRYDAYLVHVPHGDALRIGFSSAEVFGTSSYCRVEAHPASGGGFITAGVQSGTGVRTLTNGSGYDWLVVEVGTNPLGPSGHPCDSYDLSISTTTTPCSSGPDSLEGAFGNDERADATVLTRGVYEGLRVGSGDIDWFSVSIPPGYGLRTVLEGGDPDNPVRAALYHPAQWFTEASSAESEGQPVALVMGNTDSSPLVAHLRISHRNTAQSIGCAPYTLRVELYPALTDAYPCSGFPHWQFGPVDPELFGAASLGSDALWITPKDMPQGLFYTATLFLGFPATPPPATPGAFCLAAPVSRWVQYGGVGEWRSHVALDAGQLQPFVGATAAVQQATTAGGLTYLSNVRTFVVQ